MSFEGLVAYAAEHPRWEEIEKIVSMIIPLGENERGVPIFTCRHFDPMRKLCMDYENRPLMCSNYPYEGSSHCKHCNLTLIQINGRELAGGFGHEPFKIELS